jgi:hypothetical protein
MSLRAIALFLILLCAVTVAAQEKTDVLVMTNGDRITCEIKSLENGVLYISLDYVDGTVSVNWSKVARIESKRLFIVKTESGEALEGKISTASTQPNRSVAINVTEDAGTKIQIIAADVVSIDTSSKSFWRRFNGNVNFGMNYAKGNNSTQFNLSSSVEYPRENWSADASVDSNLSASSGSTTSTRYDAAFRVNRNLRWNKYFLTTGVRFLQSSEQGIPFQTNITGGVGYRLKNSNRIKISFVGGLAWQRTHYNDSIVEVATQNVAVLLHTQINFFKFKKTSFEVNATFLPSISDPGRRYFRLYQYYYVKLFSDLTWNISFYGNWDNRPPFGLAGSDYGTSTGLGWTFGKK